MNFIKITKNLFKIISAVHSVKKRNKNQFHRLVAKVSFFQKSAFIAGIKIFNIKPSNLTSLLNKKAQFKPCLALT
jgi:hypothetical protein